MRRYESIEAQASLWLAREDRGLSPAETAAREMWLGQSTCHRVVYLRLKAAWQRESISSAVRHAAVSPWRFPRSIGLRALAAVFLLVCLCSGGWYLLRPEPDVYVTRVGQQETVKLADGTRVELNTDTRLRVKETRAARVVRLDRGEAYLEIARDAARPFVVFAGNHKITDVGTKFSVRRDGQYVRVMVTEGKVRVGGRAASGGRAVDAAAWQCVTALGSEILVSGKSERYILDRLSWRQGLLVFDQVSLADAAAEFNRYNASHISVQGKARALRIGGRFRANNISVFVAMIRDDFGLAVRQRGNEIVVSGS